MIEPYYKDEYITLFNGDCREILPSFPDKSFDLCLTDPPYGIGADLAQAAAALQRIRANGKSKAGRGYKFYGETNWDESRPSAEVIDLLRASSREQIIWGGNYFSDMLPPTMQWLIWDKGQRDFSLADFEMAWSSRWEASRILDYPRGKALAEGERHHPTQKPIGVMKWCIELSELKTILDPFAGSCTTGVAAKILKRECTLIELSEKYCEIGANRLNKPIPLFDSIKQESFL